MLYIKHGLEEGFDNLNVDLQNNVIEEVADELWTTSTGGMGFKQVPQLHMHGGVSLVNTSDWKKQPCAGSKPTNKHKYKKVEPVTSTTLPVFKEEKPAFIKSTLRASKDQAY